MPIEASKTPKQTVVEEGTEFKGTIKSSCAVVINGTIDGDVDAPEVTITRSGSIAGAVKATKLRAQGTLSGKVEATDVFLSGVVRSNTAIKAKRLEAKLGSESAQIEVTFGECALEVGDALAEPAAVAPPARSEPPPPADGEGWGVPAADASASPSPPVAAASAAPGNGTRSPWKPSRSIEVGDAAKTLR
ncbi:MAG TPA: polymer-forming cytoskeletal protein [Polyangiaceae bacterium]|nr:polymer-forming cytoskeletal protein [Polyangiaceae bacterium]